MDKQIEALLGIYEAVKRWARANRFTVTEALICLNIIRRHGGSNPAKPYTDKLPEDVMRFRQAIIGLYAAVERWAMANRFTVEETLILLETIRRAKDNSLTNNSVTKRDEDSLKDGEDE